MAARSARALREKRTLATVAGEELPHLVLGCRVEGLVVPALQLRQLLLGEIRRGRVARDIGGDQVGEPVLIRRRERGAAFVEDEVEAGVHGIRIREGTVGSNGYRRTARSIASRIRRW
jgi:hypothetical protein